MCDEVLEHHDVSVSQGVNQLFAAFIGEPFGIAEHHHRNALQRLLKCRRCLPSRDQHRGRPMAQNRHWMPLEGGDGTVVSPQRDPEGDHRPRPSDRRPSRKNTPSPVGLSGFDRKFVESRCSDRLHQDSHIPHLLARARLEPAVVVAVRRVRQQGSVTGNLRRNTKLLYLPSHSQHFRLQISIKSPARQDRHVVLSMLFRRPQEKRNDVATTFAVPPLAMRIHHS